MWKDLPIYHDCVSTVYFDDCDGIDKVHSRSFAWQCFRHEFDLLNEYDLELYTQRESSEKDLVEHWRLDADSVDEEKKCCWRC